MRATSNVRVIISRGRRPKPHHRTQSLCEDARAGRSLPATLVPRIGDPSDLIKLGFECPPSSTYTLPPSRTGLLRKPQLTALAIIGRLNGKHPEQFGMRQ